MAEKKKIIFLMEKAMDGEQKEIKEQMGGVIPEKSDFRDEKNGSAEQPVSQEKTLERTEGGMEKDSAYHKILAQTLKKSSGTDDGANVSDDAKSVSAEADYESKVVKLVTIAENKGVVHAVKVARHLEDNYVLDELHDRLLADDLHVALVKKGVIKEV